MFWPAWWVTGEQAISSDLMYCSTQLSVSGEWMSASKMQQEFAGGATVQDYSARKREKLRVNLFLPSYVYVFFSSLSLNTNSGTISWKVFTSRRCSARPFIKTLQLFKRQTGNIIFFVTMVWRLDVKKMAFGRCGGKCSPVTNGGYLADCRRLTCNIIVYCTEFERL